MESLRSQSLRAGMPETPVRPTGLLLPLLSGRCSLGSSSDRSSATEATPAPQRLLLAG